MAKKGQAVQLQTEVNTDEEWEKLLQREGLILVDVYSEWCGPCSGMTANLKKLKLEIGGDLLQLAIAKCDKITALERFRNKCEPTWMFIVNGKMVNFMFGANAPKLTRLIIDELKKEQEAIDGRRERVQLDIEELTDEERDRKDIVDRQNRLVREEEEQKATQELLDRRTLEARRILDSLHHLGVVMIFPHARPKYLEVLRDLLDEAGLTISQTDKRNVTLEEIEELFYFYDGEEDIPIEDDALEELLHLESLILLIKPIPARDQEEPTDDLLRKVVYGDRRAPPGDHNCPGVILSKIVVGGDNPDTETQSTMNSIKEEIIHRRGIWIPLTDLIKATALRLFFPKIADNYLIAEPPPLPPYYTMIFDSIRRHDLAPLMDKYQKEIMRYGFFTSEHCEDAKLIAKNVHKFEHSAERSPEDKLVFQLSKKKSECVLAFLQFKPLYMSANPKEGARECKLFFPEGYDEPASDEEITEVSPEEEEPMTEDQTVDEEMTETIDENPTETETIVSTEEVTTDVPETTDEEQ